MFPKGAWLDLEHPDEETDVESHLLHELDDLLHKHGLEYEPERRWLHRTAAELQLLVLWALSCGQPGGACPGHAERYS